MFTKPLPVLPLRDAVVFPHSVVPLAVGRARSVAAIEEAHRQASQRQTTKKHDSGARLILAAQRDGNVDEPGPKDLHDTATLGEVIQNLKMPDGTMKVLVKGIERVKISEYIVSESILLAQGDVIEDVHESQQEIDALMRLARPGFESFLKNERGISSEKISDIKRITDPSQFSDIIANHSPLPLIEKQSLLENANVLKRLDFLYKFIRAQEEVHGLEKRIRSRVKRQMERTQREYFLNEQMKAIQKELGDGDDERNEINEYETRIKKTKLSKEARTRAESELKKLRQMNTMSAEATVLRNYLDWLLGIPWAEYSKVRHDLARAERILNQDHFALDKVKERVLEYLAVQARMKKMKGPILCLVGPPGVGKTSLGKSLARATGRKFARMSLGGVRDEAEIRGHRRTYIGSLPGKIIQTMKKVGKANPLILLDEVDKLGADWRGDPSSALLEVLDPEQNHAFNDHYLEVDYDLSEVMFITTANSLNMPRPLMDRMEIIRIAGYTEDEKVEIARRHLLKKQRAAHGLSASEWTINEAALRNVIRYYTRESGVRNLERELAKIARKTVREISMEETESKTKPKAEAKKTGAVASSAVESKPDSTKPKTRATGVRNLKSYLGVPRFRFGLVEQNDMVGVVTGLAWTEVGGEILTIEAVLSPGKGKISKTGKLGDVMRESVEAAGNYIKSRAPSLGIDSRFFEKADLHLHVPEGATPKDGPSAGIAMVCAMASVLTNTPVHKSVAMTGEVTLRGRVLPIGGLKEKLLAALRSGIDTVIVPAENTKDLEEMPANITEALNIVPVDDVDDAIRHALVRRLKPATLVESDLKKEFLPVPVNPKDSLLEAHKEQKSH